MHTYIHMYVRTYVRTYIHTYIHTYTHTYIHTYTQTCIHMYIHACMHACTCTYVRTSGRTYVHTYLHTYFLDTHFPMQYLYTESLSHPSFTFLWLLNGKKLLLRWPAAAACTFAFVVPLLDSFLLRQFIHIHTHTYTCTPTHTHAHITPAFRWPHNAHIHTCIHIHTHFHARFYHTHTHTPHFYARLHTLLSRTSLRHTFVAHADPSPSLFSFLHLPPHLYLSFAAYWKKLTCGVIRSFNLRHRQVALAARGRLLFWKLAIGSLQLRDGLNSKQSKQQKWWKLKSIPES